MKAIILLLFPFFLVFPDTGRKNLPVHVQIGSQTIKKNQWYSLGEDSIRITELKFYLSDILLKDAEGKLIQSSDKLFLFKLGESESITLESNELVDSMLFQLGIDSLTHENAEYSGALDPAKGMYWAWHTGFIHFKLEGAIISDGQEKKIALHIGGYQGPYRTNQSIALKLEENTLHLDLFQLLKSQKSLNQWSIMSAGKEAKETSDRLCRCFK